MDTVGYIERVVASRELSSSWFATIHHCTTIELPEQGECRHSEPHNEGLIEESSRYLREVFWPVGGPHCAVNISIRDVNLSIRISEADGSICVPSYVSAINGVNDSALVVRDKEVVK